MTDETLLAMQKRFAPVDLPVDTSHLTPGDRTALRSLIAAARVIDGIFLSQKWRGNPALLAKLREDRSPSAELRLRSFLFHKGPWSDLDNHTAFLPDVPARKPLGAGYYPEDMTREEFEAWSAESGQGRDFYSVIARDHGELRAIPYSEAYRDSLAECAALLREAAVATDNESLRHFLRLRADAFASNNYVASDMAWMDVDAPLDVTIGPYETYNDELFGYKAAFEAYVTVRDDAASERLKFFGDHMQELEDHLPIDARYRNTNAAPLAPVRIVNQIFAAGDADHGVKAAAFNLPNEEQVVAVKGTKQVMLKNVQEAKFRAVLVPVAEAVLRPEAVQRLQFDSFFTHILAHEVSHGVGPRMIVVDGRETTPRQELKDTYSAIEEAKADTLGLFVLQHFADRGYLELNEAALYTTYLASSFRTLRFGLGEAHGKGMAIQFHTMVASGAFVLHGDGWDIDASKFRDAVRDLARELLTIEATGDIAGARRMLEERGVLSAEAAATLARIGAVPVDIDVHFVTADSLG